jgi:hypothetical protein
LDKNTIGTISSSVPKKFGQNNILNLELFLVYVNVLFIHEIVLKYAKEAISLLHLAVDLIKDYKIENKQIQVEKDFSFLRNLFETMGCCSE